MKEMCLTLTSNKKINNDLIGASYYQLFIKKVVVFLEF